MSVKTHIGFVTGSRQQPTLLITVHETAGTTLAYNTALAAALNIAPASIFNATLNTFDVAVIDRSRDCIQFELNYGRKSILTLTSSIAAATEPRNRFAFFSPIAAYDDGGDVTSSYDYLKWKLHRAGSMAEFNSGKPVAVDPLKESRTLNYTTAMSFVNDAYVNLMEDMVNHGVFNNAIFWGHPVATLQFVSFSAIQQADGGWELTYGMGRRAYRTDVGVGDGIVIPELRGCDDYWPLEVEVLADSKVQPKIKAVIVGQLWELDDFTLLNLPWQGTLTTRTNDTSGIITTLYTHDVATFVTLYWEGGFRLAANVSGATTTTITFSAGSGDVLPPAGTRVLAIE